MDIPGWFAWLALAPAVLQALGLVPVVHRLRGPDASARFQARLDLLHDRYVPGARYWT
ncbi:hypothetical protein ACIQJT_27210 [Streptomyces sp. NPDC091972]|uniref:hypothetical protein n=1 Tax=Streptomyces sp. NPDC091972 TaxID=3366007 RepID=UPI00382A18E4